METKVPAPPGMTGAAEAEAEEDEMMVAEQDVARPAYAASQVRRIKFTCYFCTVL